MVSLEVACRPVIEKDQTTVLVVEDEVLIRLMIADALRAQGISVIEASNGDEAMRVLQSELPIQLVITDIRMANESDGLALARAARRASRPEAYRGVKSASRRAGRPRRCGFQQAVPPRCNCRSGQIITRGGAG